MKVSYQTYPRPLESHCFSGLPIFVMESELPAELKVKNVTHIKTYNKTWRKVTTINRCNL